jgi:Maltokinase N-terminal cap domain
MGLVHFRATLEPSKQELAEAWLPSRPWATGGSLEKVAEYRFDDPEGEVGVETILWRTSDGTVLQIPFTYRSAPLDGADAHLVGTSDHTVLGKRWVYDGCADPIWAATITSVVLTGGTQAQMVIEKDGELVDVPPRMQVRGTGTTDAPLPAIASVDAVDDDGPVTTVTAGPVTISLPRVVGVPVEGDAILTGHVGDDSRVLTLAAVRRLA